jgi:methanogenic corrinoid protein MtbC1
MRRYLDSGHPAREAAELASAIPLTVRPGAGPAVGAREVIEAHAEMRAGLDRFDETAAQRVLERLFSEYSALTVVRDVLMPYLAQVGDRWAEGDLNVAQEHFASNFLHARLLAISRGWDRGIGPRALIACAPRELHTFGLIAFGIALHDVGWRITYLGADTPLAMIVQAAEQTHPDLVVISAQMNQRLRRQDVGLRAIAARWPLALGGSGANAEQAARVDATLLQRDPLRAALAVSLK